MIAVIPAAGLGKRMRESTGGSPKELLRVGGRPVLDWVIQESLDSGAERGVVVGSPRKPAVREWVESLADARVEYVEQPDPIGMGHAVACGAERGLAALALMADTVFPMGSPAALLAGQIDEGAFGAVAVQQVALERVSAYGIVGFGADGSVVQVVEKPNPQAAPSTWAIASRFALSGEAIDVLRHMVAEPELATGLTLSEVLQWGLQQGRRVAAVKLEDAFSSFDCGDPEGYRRALESLGA